MHVRPTDCPAPPRGTRPRVSSEWLFRRKINGRPSSRIVGPPKGDPGGLPATEGVAPREIPFGLQSYLSGSVCRLDLAPSPVLPSKRRYDGSPNGFTLHPLLPRDARTGEANGPRASVDERRLRPPRGVDRLDVKKWAQLLGCASNLRGPHD